MKIVVKYLITSKKDVVGVYKTIIKLAVYSSFPDILQWTKENGLLTIYYLSCFVLGFKFACNMTENLVWQSWDINSVFFFTV